MNEDYYKNEHMHYLFRYIENNLSDDLDTTLLANIGYVSRDKLYHDFYNISGHSVKEYIRKRRLSNALALLKTSDMSITDIAFQCGYSSHQALCRSVKQTLNLTPSEYKMGDTYYFFPPFGNKPLQSITVSNYIIPSTLRILYYHSRLTNIENIAIRKFMNTIPNYSGRIFGRNGKQVGNKFCYELYLTDTKCDYSVLNSCGFKIEYEIPCINAMFATSLVHNNEQQINTAWDYLYSEWLQNSMFEYTGNPYYEEYIIKNGKTTKLKLYLPIRERTEITKISLIKNPELHFITAKATGYNAEEIASEIVMKYITSNYPYIISTSKELYLHKGINSCNCGVRINSGLRLVKDKNIISFTTNSNNYLVLESNVMGDYDRYAEMLYAFAFDNGMNIDKKEIFAVYEAKEDFNNLKIKMYCPIKIRTK